jgi:8-oxo-dGTP pyrophosphatase MutT (NUDIX family)
MPEGPSATPSNAGPQPAVPLPAATVVLLRPAAAGGEPEVLLTRRPSTMAFAAGMEVFPGGRVDDADADPAVVQRSARRPEDAAAILGGVITPAEAAAIHLAGLRELLEEVGILLAHGGHDAASVEVSRKRLLTGATLANAVAELPAALATDRLVPIARWTTPAFMPRRFATWFFVADAPDGATTDHRLEEVESVRWVGPRVALDGLATGETSMWIPTVTVLQRLVELGASTAADVAAAIRFGEPAAPRVVAEGPDDVRMAVGEAGGVPGREGIVRLIGRRDVVVVDPGDASEVALAAVRAAIARRDGGRRGRPVAIVLTSPAPDQAAGAEALAIELQVPILVAPGAGRWLPYEVRELADGERLPADVEVRVRVGAAGSGRLELARS